MKKEEYIKEICALLETTEDIPLLDLICRLLRKSV